MLLSLLLSPYRRSRAVRVQDVVEYCNHLVDMNPLDDVRWQETQNLVVSAIDDDPAFKHLLYCCFRHIGELEFCRNHQSQAADFLDDLVLRLQLSQPCLKIKADF